MIKALAHPARIAIIEHLIRVNKCICGDIVKELPLAQATISQHLKDLKNAGIIQGAIQGNSICYCINPKSLQKLIDYFFSHHHKKQQQKMLLTDLYYSLFFLNFYHYAIIRI